MSTVTIPQAAALSKLDVQALRQADSVSFHYWEETSPEVRSVSVIRANKEVPEEKRGPFGDREVSRSVYCDVSFARLSEERPTKCFAMIMCAKYRDTWQTVVGLLKAGDALSLRWCPDHGTNGYCKAARISGDASAPEHAGVNGAVCMSIHVDELYLVVRRGKKTLTFLIEVSTCPDNTARMCRRV